MWRWVWLPVLFLSALAGAQVTEVHDIVYTQGGGAPQTLDLYAPALPSQALRPGIVFVHGGGWSAGSKDDFADWGRYYAGFGYVSISINYRLSPQYSWPAQIDDTQAAVRWFRKNAAAWGVDPKRIGAVGASAGGHLVLLLGTTDTLNDKEPSLHGYSSKVQAVGDYSGPTDFSKPSEWNPDIWQLIAWMVGETTPPGPIWNVFNMNYRKASPIFQVTSDDAPTIMFHGDADPVVPVDQARRMFAALTAKGVPVSYYEFPGEGHGFTSGPFWVSINALTDFFAAHLASHGPTAPPIAP